MNPLDRLGRHPRSGAEVVLVGFSGALRSAVVGFAPREVLCCALDVLGHVQRLERLGRHGRSELDVLSVVCGADFDVSGQ